MSAKKKKTGGGAAKRAAKGAAAPALSRALAEAAWAEADDALAEALLEWDEFNAAAEDDARQAALALLGQALARAARHRGLTRIGALDARTVFDPAQHDFTAAAARQPKTVRIVARGVARGAEVLRRPRVAPPRRKAKR